MPRIAVSGPIHDELVGHYRVSLDYGDRLVEFSPTFPLVDVADPIGARAMSQILCEATAHALVQAGVTVSDVSTALVALHTKAAPDKLLATAGVAA